MEEEQKEGREEGREERRKKWRGGKEMKKWRGWGAPIAALCPVPALLFVGHFQTLTPIHPQPILHALPLPTSDFCIALLGQKLPGGTKPAKLLARPLEPMCDKRVLGASRDTKTASQSVGDVTLVLTPGLLPSSLIRLPSPLPIHQHSGAFLPENADLWGKGRGRKGAGKSSGRWGRAGRLREVTKI